MNKMMLRGRAKKLLDSFEGGEPLRRLFWSELNYERRDDPLSMRGWPETVIQVLAEGPTILASGGSGDEFEVIYCRLHSERLSLVEERRVVKRAEKASALVIDKDRAAYDEDEVSKPSRPNYEPSEG